MNTWKLALIVKKRIKKNYPGSRDAWALLVVSKGPDAKQCFIGNHWEPLNELPTFNANIGLGLLREYPTLNKCSGVRGISSFAAGFFGAARFLLRL